jgi:hypothetical protein
MEDDIFIEVVWVGGGFVGQWITVYGRYQPEDAYVPPFEVD